MKEREKITMLTTIIIVVAIYFVAMLGIGWYGRRYSSTFDGYLSMGRSGGILLLMGSAIGANIGNGFVVGGAGGGATSGLAGSAYGLACAVSTLVAVFLCDFIYKHKPSSIENRQRLGVSLYGNGWPGAKVRWCTGQLKTHLISKEVNRLKGEYQALHYVGIAADEPKRIKNEQYPLVDWGITEAEALKLCYDRGYDWGGLYEIYHRCSCWCCPLQRIDELRKLRHHHPELWKRLRDMDQRAIAQFGHNPLGQFKQNWTVERLEQRFAAEDAQISVFLSSGKDSTMTEKQKQECSEVETMLQGTPKQNVLISFDGKPPKTLEELEKEQKRQKKKHKDRGEAR